MSSLGGNLQIMWLVDIFRAKIVDTSEDSLTIEVNSVISLAFSCVLVIIMVYEFSFGDK